MILMSKKKGFGKFLVGAAIGAGLGVLFAPKKGSETRKELKAKIDELLDNVKKITVEDIKEEFDNKLEIINNELEDLDKEKVLKIAKKKAEELKKDAEELVELAVQKGTPVLSNIAEEIRLKAIEVTKDVLKKLEDK